MRHSRHRNGLPARGHICLNEIPWPIAVSDIVDYRRGIDGGQSLPAGIAGLVQARVAAGPALCPPGQLTFTSRASLRLSVAQHDILGVLLASAYPDRIARISDRRVTAANIS